MWKIRVRPDRKWLTIGEFLDRDEAIKEYNSCGILPRMFIGPKGIENKQYTNNGYQWTPKERP